jgi:hypothetical protein
MEMAATFLRFLQRQPAPDRRGTAAAIRNLLDAAEEPPSHWRAHGIDPPLRSAAVRAARGDLRAIAKALESDRHQAPQIIECASWLAWARESPVCTEPADEDSDVTEIARRIRAALGA